MAFLSYFSIEFNLILVTPIVMGGRKKQKNMVSEL